jgi:hypothetical protein
MARDGRAHRARLVVVEALYEANETGAQVSLGLLDVMGLRKDPPRILMEAKAPNAY